MHPSLRRCLLILYLLAFNNSLWTQTRDREPIAAPGNLHQLARTAGTIFAGTIVSIHPCRAASTGTIASVEITVQVEQGIRGARTGQTLTFREWAGLWSADERYRVGERMVLFLYAPSALGLTSPVGGTAGKFKLDRDGHIVLTTAQQEEIQRSALPVRIDMKHPVRLHDFARFLRRVGEE